MPHVSPHSLRLGPNAPQANVLCVGLSTLDVVHLVDAVPAANAKVVAHAFELAAGGPAANAGVGAASCGASVTLVTALPSHPLADAVVTDLAAAGVQTVVAGRYSGPPITASILVTRGTAERAIVSPSSAAAGDSLEVVSSVPSVDGFGCVLIDGYFRQLALPLCERARTAGIPVVFDGGSFKAHTDEVLASVDVAVLSADFAPPGTGGKPEAVMDHVMVRGVRAVAITQGAGPVLWRTGGREGAVEVPTVAAVDTLGAGDFFHGALAWRVAAYGWDPERFEEDLAFAAGVASRSTLSFGTRQWLA